MAPAVTIEKLSILLFLVVQRVPQEMIVIPKTSGSPTTYARPGIKKIVQVAFGSEEIMWAIGSEIVAYSKL
jgi:hypothetical protein